MAGFGKELVWNWNFSESGWGCDACMQALAQYPPIIRGWAVVVGVRENADFPLAQYGTPGEFMDGLLLWV
eukprot:scaffold311685_cov63-Cyclotella_meneghiniana.AAC.2